MSVLGIGFVVFTVVCSFVGCSKLDEQSSDEGIQEVSAVYSITLENGETQQYQFVVEEFSSPEQMEEILEDKLAAAGVDEVCDGEFLWEIDIRIEDVNMRRRIAGRLIGGLMEGSVKHYVFLEGEWRLLTDLNYEKGLRRGETVAYYPDTGAVQIKGFFLDDKNNGLFVSFYPDGSKIAELRYVDGALNGRAEVFLKTGEIFASGVYENGERVEGTFVVDIIEFLRRSHHESFYAEDWEIVEVDSGERVSEAEDE